MKYFKSGKYKISEVKAQYKRLCKIYHPDMPTGSTEAFQELNNEYKYILQSAQKQAEQKGNFKKSKNLEKEIKLIDKLISKLPAELQPIAKVVAKQFKQVLINELNKKL